MKRPSIVRAMTAYIYCRVSTGRQVDGTSLETQQRRCIEYCERMGWDVVRIFVEEGANAKRGSKRPKFDELLKACKQSRGKIGYVVVYAANRFARSTHDHQVVKEQLRKVGIGLRSVTEQFDDTPLGQFYEALASAQAELDNSIRSSNTTDGMFACASKGQWVWKNPIGFLIPPPDSSGPSLIHDPARAGFIRAGFEMMATGEHSKVDVLAHVTALGLRKADGRPLTAQDISKLLENPIYAGRVVIPSWKIDTKGDFEPIVGETTFQAVGTVLKGRRPAVRTRLRDNPEFPLRRFVRCAHCNAPFTGSRSKGRHTSYPYYRCRDLNCPGSGATRGSVPKERLEATFLETLRQLAPSGQLGPLFRVIVKDVWNKRGKDEGEKRRALRRRLAEIEAEQRTLTMAVAKGTIDKVAYDDLLAQLRTDASRVQVELGRASSDGLELERALDLGERLLDDAGRLWTELDAGRKARLQHFIYPDGITFDGEAFGTAPTCGIFALAGVARAETGPPTPVGAGVGGGMVTPRGFEPLSPG